MRRAELVVGSEVLLARHHDWDTPRGSRHGIQRARVLDTGRWIDDYARAEPNRWELHGRLVAAYARPFEHGQGVLVEMLDVDDGTPRSSGALTRGVIVPLSRVRGWWDDCSRIVQTARAQHDEARAERRRELDELQQLAARLAQLLNVDAHEVTATHGRITIAADAARRVADAQRGASA